MDTVIIEKQRGLYWLWLSLIIIILDQSTKYLIVYYEPYTDSIYLLSFLNITLAHNRGAAFNFLSQKGNLALWFFMTIATLISAVLCIWLYRLPSRNYWLKVSLALILGGAIGNLLDRISYGFVIDFIHFHIQDWSWPIFNFADTAISIGSGMLVVDIFRKR